MMRKLIVASNSPRRQELMAQLGFEFDVFTADIDEYIPEHIPITEAAIYLAKHKNTAYRKLCNDEVILTSDTVVIAGDKILGKPRNKKEAKKMLEGLSNNTHKVISGVCISDINKNLSFDDVTFVRFKNLTLNEINFYIEHFEPYDKAGAYGIQEWIGMIAVDRIEGSFYNVMGLPVNKVYNSLVKEFSLSCAKQPRSNI